MLHVKYARMCDREQLCFFGLLVHKIWSDNAQVVKLEAEAQHAENIAIHAQ